MPTNPKKNREEKEGEKKNDWFQIVIQESNQIQVEC
jgi:hypothetical protein